MTESDIRNAITAHEGEIWRMCQLAGFAHGDPQGGGLAEWFVGQMISQPIGWTLAAPEAYRDARDRLESMLAAARLEAEEATRALATLAETPTPLTGSSAAAELAQRVRHLEARRATATTVANRIAGALDRRAPNAAAGIKRTLRILLGNFAARVAQDAASAMQAAMPRMRTVLEGIDAFEHMVASADRLIGEQAVKYEIHLPEIDAWRRIVRGGEAPGFVDRQPSERKVA